MDTFIRDTYYLHQEKRFGDYIWFIKNDGDFQPSAQNISVANLKCLNEDAFCLILGLFTAIKPSLESQFDNTQLGSSELVCVNELLKNFRTSLNDCQCYEEYVKFCNSHYSEHFSKYLARQKEVWMDIVISMRNVIEELISFFATAIHEKKFVFIMGI